MTDMSKIAGIVERVIYSTLTYLKNVYTATLNEQYDDGMSLIFPKDKVGNVRVSEQELRFAFVKEFEKYCRDEAERYYYTVETPTISPYHFSENGKSIKPEIGNGRAGQFDMVIHNSNCNKICIIEFKSDNVVEEKLEPSLLKIANPDEGGNEVERFFIHIVENSDSGTTESIENKLAKLSKGENWKTIVHYYCLTLNNREKNNKEDIIIKKNFSIAPPEGTLDTWLKEVNQIQEKTGHKKTK